MLLVFYSVLPLFLIVFLGIVLKKIWLTSDTLWSGLALLSAFIFFPVQLFILIVNAKLDGDQFFRLIFAILSNTALVATIIILLHTRFNFPKKQFACVAQGAIRYNSYVFLGVGTVLFGKTGLEFIAIISVYTLPFIVLFIIIWHGIFITSDNSPFNFKTLSTTLKTILLNPLFISIILGVIFNVHRIPVPSFARHFLDALASCAIGIAYLSIGAKLQIKIKKDYLKYVVMAVTIKLIISPILMFIILKIFNIKGVAANVALLASCCPTSNGAPAFSKHLGSDFELMTSITAIALICSVVTIPCVMLLSTI